MNPSSPERPLPERILVVDDEANMLGLFKKILEKEGYEVVTAASGEEALAMALANRYGLFLVDVEMPGMDGFSFIERARAEAALRDVPSVLVTSRSAPEDRLRGEQVGARAYVVKSEFDQATLLGFVGRLLETG